MATKSRIEVGLHVAGPLSCESFAPPDGCIDDDAVAADAGVAATKLQHQHVASYSQSGTAAAATVQLHTVYGTSGSTVSVKAGVIGACTGDSTITIDVKKNGTTILTGAIVLDNTNAAYASEAGTISVSSLAAGDVLTVVVTVSAGTGTLGTGLWVSAVTREDAE